VRAPCAALLAVQTAPGTMISDGSTLEAMGLDTAGVKGFATIDGVSLINVEASLGGLHHVPSFPAFPGRQLGVAWLLPSGKRPRKEELQLCG
jgi:hypothetical protein